MFLCNISHYIIHKSEDIDLINLIFSTNGHLLCIILTSTFAKLKLFSSLTKNFLEQYKTKIHIFTIRSTTKSSIKVKILIWSTWFFQQMVIFYAFFWQVLLQSSNLFFFTFMKHFLQPYETKIHIFFITSNTLISF